jgi:glycosyltransferase involved in cell wall biosynthesis
LVGTDPTPEVRALACDAIEVTGYVDDVRPHLDRARVFVCPLRKGAGIKNKILQAWAMGKAVVATPQSVGGLEVQEGVNVLVRPFNRGFVEAIVALLNDPARAAALGEAGRRTVLDHYTWDLKAAELDRQLHDVACRAGRIPHA